MAKKKSAKKSHSKKHGGKHEGRESRPNDAKERKMTGYKGAYR
jgi:hypothetical protein